MISAGHEMRPDQHPGGLVYLEDRRHDLLHARQFLPDLLPPRFPHPPPGLVGVSDKLGNLAPPRYSFFTRSPSRTLR